MDTCKDFASDIQEHKKIGYLSINNKDYADQIEINLGDDYEYKFEMNRLYILKKKPKYPTNYNECCEILVGRKHNSNEIPFDRMELCLGDLDNTQSIFFQVPYLSQLNSLFRVLMCRKAYWKIVGEEMGLGKPWEPDWKNGAETKYTIVYSCSMILNGTTNLENKILAFPTEEMRDAFYENFKNLIKSCKELL